MTADIAYLQNLQQPLEELQVLFDAQRAAYTGNPMPPAAQRQQWLKALRDLLSDEPVWEKLRRFLRSGRLQIEEPPSLIGPFAAMPLEPEPVDADVKLVLIASVEDYYAVQEGDPEFARRFRCKVDFADSFAAEAATRQATAIFVAHTCRRLGLPHFNAAAVAALLEDAHREAEDQRRQSAIFAHTEVLLMEAAMLAHATAHLVSVAVLQSAFNT